MTPRPEFKDCEEQAYLGIRCEVTDGVPAAVDSAFPQLVSHVSERGIEPASAPIIRILEVDPSGEPLVLDVGIPTASGEVGNVPVRAYSLPAGRYLTLLHVGPYRSETEPDLSTTRAELERWAGEHGIACSLESDRGRTLAAAVDHLLISPPTEPDYSKWETELAYLVIES